METEKETHSQLGLTTLVEPCSIRISSGGELFMFAYALFVIVCPIQQQVLTLKSIAHWYIQ